MHLPLNLPALSKIRTVHFNVVICNTHSSAWKPHDRRWRVSHRIVRFAQCAPCRFVFRLRTFVLRPSRCMATRRPTRAERRHGASWMERGSSINKARKSTLLSTCAAATASSCAMHSLHHVQLPRYAPCTRCTMCSSGAACATLKRILRSIASLRCCCAPLPPAPSFPPAAYMRIAHFCVASRILARNF
jgi:hypothetical protein